MAFCSSLGSPDSEYRQSTPFTSLFEHYLRSLSAGSIASPSQGMFDIAQALLSAGQNQDVDIPLKEGKSCKPLHILHSNKVVTTLTSISTRGVGGRAGDLPEIVSTLYYQRSREWIRV